MICAVILAAGQSQRMGVQKLLLPYGGKSIIAHVVDEVLRSAIDGAWVVVGYEADRIIAELSGRGVAIARNPNYAAGMLSSVRCGLEALPAECEAVMVVLGDQPALTAELVDEMTRTFRGTDKGILVPIHRGHRGHPILFSAAYRNEILTRYDDAGLRGLLRAHADDVFELSVPGRNLLPDLDGPEDYRRALALLESALLRSSQPPQDGSSNEVASSPESGSSQ